MPRSVPSAAGRALLVLLLAISWPASAGAGEGGVEADDPVFVQGLQWSLDRIGAPEAWSRSTGQGITVAIVDSGVDLAHEELADKLVGQVSCIGADGDPSRCQGQAEDDNGHGTHVAGIAVAATGNGRGIAGVAPDAELMAVRVLTNSCDGNGRCSATGSAGDVAAGIRWAADHGADVINLSLGGGALQGALGCSFCDAVEYAWSQGAISVIAAGNDSVLPSGFGGEHAVIVTATTRDDARASYSNASSGLVRAARWPVSAPGGEGETDASDCATGGTPKGVLSTYWVPDHRNQYACLAGTSMAAPHVSGALAVLLAQGHSPDAAVEQFLDTAEDLGTPGRDDQFGWGRLDLARAAGAAPGGTATAPTAPPTTATTTAAGDPGMDLPGQDEAATFTPARPSTGTDDPPRWLVVLAVAAVLTSAVGTVVTARRSRTAPRP